MYLISSSHIILLRVQGRERREGEGRFPLPVNFSYVTSMGIFLKEVANSTAVPSCVVGCTFLFSIR